MGSTKKCFIQKSHGIEGNIIPMFFLNDLFVYEISSDLEFFKWDAYLFVSEFKGALSFL